MVYGSLLPFTRKYQYISSLRSLYHSWLPLIFKPGSQPVVRVSDHRQRCSFSVCIILNKQAFCLWSETLTTGCEPGLMGLISGNMTYWLKVGRRFWSVGCSAHTFYTSKTSHSTCNKIKIMKIIVVFGKFMDGYKCLVPRKSDWIQR